MCRHTTKQSQCPWCNCTVLTSAIALMDEGGSSVKHSLHSVEKRSNQVAWIKHQHIVNWKYQNSVYYLYIYCHCRQHIVLSLLVFSLLRKFRCLANCIWYKDFTLLTKMAWFEDGRNEWALFDLSDLEIRWDIQNFIGIYWSTGNCTCILGIMSGNFNQIKMCSAQMNKNQIKTKQVYTKTIQYQKRTKGSYHNLKKTVLIISHCRLLNKSNLLYVIM